MESSAFRNWEIKGESGWAEYRAVFGPNPDRHHPLFQEIDARGRLALSEQLAIKSALYSIKAVERLFPRAVRATCHTGTKNGVAVLGLRAHPQYLRACKLPPYHGVALISSNGAPRPRLRIEPEFTLRGRADFLRVVDTDGRTWAYLAASPAGTDPGVAERALSKGRGAPRRGLTWAARRENLRPPFAPDRQRVFVFEILRMKRLFLHWTFFGALGGAITAAAAAADENGPLHSLAALV